MEAGGGSSRAVNHGKSLWPHVTTAAVQRIAVTAGPSGLLWIVSWFYVHTLLKSPDKSPPESRLFKGRMVASTVLAMLYMFEVTLRVLEQKFVVDAAQLSVVSPVLLLATAVLSTELSRLEQRKGVTSSVVLSVFWLALLVSSILSCFYTDQVSSPDPVNVVLFYMRLVVIFCLLLLCCLAGKYEETHWPPGKRKPCPEPDESLWSRLTFSWMKELLVKANRGKMTENDVFDVLPDDRSCQVMSKFALAWGREMDKAKLRNTAAEDQEEEIAIPDESIDDILSKTQKKKKVRKRTKSEEIVKDKIPYERSKSDFYPRTGKNAPLDSETEAERGSEKTKTRTKAKSESKPSTKAQVRPSVFLALLKAFGVDFLLQQLCRLINTLLHLAQPLILGLLLEFTEDKTAPVSRGYLICLMMVLCQVLQTFMNVRTHYLNHSFGLRIKCAINNSVYNKVLTMDSESRQASTVGQAVNLLSVDANDICMAFCEMASEMWTVPVKIVVTLVMLYKLLGPSMLISVVIMAALTPFNTFVTRKLTAMHQSLMEKKDHRLKMLTEVVNGIKILKMYTWEPSFLKKVNDARDKELEVMSRRVFWETVTHFHWEVTPYMVSVTLLLMYVYSSEDHYLDPSTAFVALSVIDILRDAMAMVPHMISRYVKVVVSFRRVNDFLNRTDLDVNVHDDGQNDKAIVIKDGFFSWNSGVAPTLKNINLSVKKGSLVAVVGTVGCGKSSLVSACLGEMKKLKGHVSVKGSIAYVPQQAWIQHATLKDNVLFGQDLNDDLYNQCLDNCALRPDLETLPGGDLTEIGEKGINISGGQKQRVSLARAVYSQADLYLLDDPLSAVDCHVGTHIFNKVVGHQGMLAGKTRVLVTHGVQWLPMVDQIIVIRHGRMSEVGSYEELLTHNGPFAKFLKHYLTHVPEDDSNPEVEKIKGSILHRLESIPKGGKENPNAEDEDSTENQQESTESSSDNESVIQELLASAAHAETRPHQTDCKSGQDGSADEDNDEETSTGEKAEEKNKASLVQEEDFIVQHANLNTFKGYAQAIGYSWVLLMVSLYVVSQLAERGHELFLSRWTDDPHLKNLTALPADSADRARLNNHYLLLYAGCGVIYAVAQLSFKIIQLMRQVIMARILHNKMLSRVLRAPMTFFDTTPVGRIVSRFSADLHVVDTRLTQTTEWAVNLLLSLICQLAIVCYVTPLLFLMVLPMASVFYYVQHWFVPTMRQLERLMSKTRPPVYSFFSETLGGTAVIRAYGAQKRFITEFQRRSDTRASVSFCWGSIDKWMIVRMEGMGTLVIAAVVTSAIIFRDSMTAGMVGLTVSVALDLTETVRQMVFMVSWIQTELVCVDRVREYSTMAVEADWRKEESAPSASWPEKGEIQIADLALRYREGLDLVLKGINVNIEARQKVGIVGRTGAGKSSLTLALFRMIEPARGEVRIDDLSTSDLGLHDLRSRLTILPQDPVIFAGSLRMNLDPFAHYTDGELWEALKHAHLSDFVSGLKEELDHECGEGGGNLSVGQRQLLCLARTLLHKTRVLVLDEATAAVDMETDDLIQRTIRSEFKDCTVLTIAHRLNTVIDYDKILVLDKGQVVEYDSTANLINNPTSIFYDMARKAGLLNKK